MPAKFAKLIVASPEKSSDIFYATGFCAPDSFLYFEVGKEKILAISPLEYDRAVKACGGKMRIVETDGIAVSERILNFCHEYAVKKVQVPFDFPAGLALELISKGLAIEPLKGIFFPGRETKNKEEINKITFALRIAESAMHKAEDIIAESSVGRQNVLIWHGEILTSETLRRLIDMEISSNGAVPKNNIVACGEDSAEPHNVGHGPLKACTPIIIDLFPRAESGYWGDITRTFIKWKASKKFLSIYDAVKSAGEKAFAKARAGIPAADLHNLAFDFMKSKGFKTGKMKGKNCGFFHGLGHGVGLDIHEEPRISPKNLKPLKSGNIITIEPGLYYPGFGGVRIEDMVLIKNSEAELLDSFHKNPVIE